LVFPVFFLIGILLGSHVYYLKILMEWGEGGKRIEIGKGFP